jgi:hypothetical protein
MFRNLLKMLGWKRTTKALAAAPIKTTTLNVESLEDRIVPSSADLPHPFSGQFFSQDFQAAGAQYFTGDIAGEGKAALIGFSGTGQWFVDLRSGNQFNPGPKWAAASSWSQMFVGDVNGDGKTDVIGFSQAGGWWVGVSNGSTINTSKWAQWSPAAQWQAVVVGDFNGDGKTDVAALSTTGIWTVGISTGHGFSTQTWGAWSGDWSNVVVGDFTGNGKDDVAGMGADGSLWVGQSTGSSFNTTRFSIWSTPNNWQSIVVGDFNGDGKDDLAGLGTGGQWWVGQSTGTIFQTSFWGNWSGTWSHVLVGDFNGNGKADVAGLASDGSMWVGASTGKSFSSAKWASWASPGSWQAIVAGDLNGDGKTDLAGFSANSTWWTGIASGSTFSTSIWSAWVKTLAGPLTPEDPGWNPTFSQTAFTALSAAQRAQFNFNTQANFNNFTQNYLGVLRQWNAQAASAGISGDTALGQFFLDRLNTLFTQVRSSLAAKYAGLSDDQYRLLMIMNLVHGHYDFDTTVNADSSLSVLLNLQTGDCSEEAALCQKLAALMGITGPRLDLVSNFNSPQLGLFFAGHEIFYADGLWIDAETNMAFAVQPGNLLAVAPLKRTASLFNSHQVYGFFNWYMTPVVRTEQLGLGQDGGVIAYYYPYYFQSLGQGSTTLGVD